MSRITDYAANSQITGYMLDIQKRLKDTEIQVTSEKVSQDYQGIANQAQRLVTLESTVQMLDLYQRNNDTMDLRLSTAGTTVEGISNTIHDFEQVLETFNQNGSYDEDEVADLQDWAFRSLQMIQGYLNTEADNGYLFSGSRVTTKPVDLGLTTLEDFQATYNGESVTFPTTRDAHLLDAITLTPADTGNLTYTAGPPGTISAATAGAFAGLPVGSTITIAGSAVNNGTYTIAAIDATNTTITLNPTVTLNDNGGVAAAYGSITTPDNYYSGDNQSYTHRVNERQTFEYSATAIDPAFEKAIRAMSIIAQGEFGTPGGLDQNRARVDDAIYLLDSSRHGVVDGTPPYGAEDVSNLDGMESKLAFDRVLLDTMNSDMKSLSSFFEGGVASIENVDLLEAVSRLLDDSRSLEASYQALAKIRSLSLTNYL